LTWADLVPGEPPSLNSERRSLGALTMLNLLSRFRSKARLRPGDAFNSSTAPSERIALSDDRAVMAYEFDGVRLLFDAERDWRFIGSLPINSTRATIALVAEAYFRGFQQAQGELRAIGLSEEFFELARQYELLEIGRSTL
jgi:hypothetical protein